MQIIFCYPEDYKYRNVRDTPSLEPLTVNTLRNEQGLFTINPNFFNVKSLKNACLLYPYGYKVSDACSDLYKVQIFLFLFVSNSSLCYGCAGGGNVLIDATYAIGEGFNVLDNKDLPFKLMQEGCFGNKVENPSICDSCACNSAGCQRHINDDYCYTLVKQANCTNSINLIKIRNSGSFDTVQQRCLKFHISNPFPISNELYPQSLALKEIIDKYRNYLDELYSVPEKDKFDSFVRNICQCSDISYRKLKAFLILQPILSEIVYSSSVNEAGMKSYLASLVRRGIINVDRQKRIEALVIYNINILNMGDIESVSSYRTLETIIGDLERKAVD